MSAEQVVLRLVRPPKAGNTIKTALFNRFYGVQTLINAYPRHAAHRVARQVQGFCEQSRKNFAPEQRIKRRKALAFKAFCAVQYALIKGLPDTMSGRPFGCYNKSSAINAEIAELLLNKNILKGEKGRVDNVFYEKATKVKRKMQRKCSF